MATTRRKNLILALLVIKVAVSSAISRIFDSSCHWTQASPGLKAKMLDIMNVHQRAISAMASLVRNGVVSPDRFSNTPAMKEIVASFAAGKVWANDHVSMCGYMKLTHV
jgi:hypothetical protein